MVDGVLRLVVEYVTRLRDRDFAELDFEGGGYSLPPMPLLKFLRNSGSLATRS